MSRRTPDAPPGMKNCVSVKCPAQNPQPVSSFHRNKREPSGYHKYCKVCRKAQAGVYKEHKRSYDGRRYSADPDLVKVRMQLYYQENTEAVKASVKEWRSAHPDLVERYRAEEQRRCRTPKGRAARRKIDHRRRARLRLAECEDFTDLEVFERDEWVCRLCLKPVDRALAFPHPESKSLDHVIPVSLGGPHTRDNTQLAHLSCNKRKGNRMEVMLNGSCAV